MTSLHRLQSTYRLDRHPWSPNLVKSIRHALRLEDHQLTSFPKVLEASSNKIHIGNGTIHSEQAQLSASVRSYCIGNFWTNCCALHWSRLFSTFLLRYRRIWLGYSLCVCFSHTFIEICDIFYDTSHAPLLRPSFGIGRSCTYLVLALHTTKIV